MLECKNLTKSFLGKKALQNVNLEIKPGQVYALLGPNGSGKTTLMKIAATLTKGYSGEMLYDGKPVGVESRREIAYMPTEAYFYPWMTVEELGKYYQDFFPDFSMERYRELIKKMELPESGKMKRFSTGMLAKLKIAVTMARDAKLYLLDEPLNGIDLMARDRIMEAIILSLKEDVSLVLSSHLVEEIEPLVNQAVFLKDGEVLECCEVESLRQQSGKSLTERYRELMG